MVLLNIIGFHSGTYYIMVFEAVFTLVLHLKVCFVWFIVVLW